MRMPIKFSNKQIYNFIKVGDIISLYYGMEKIFYFKALLLEKIEFQNKLSLCKVYFIDHNIGYWANKIHNVRIIAISSFNDGSYYEIIR